MVTSDWARVFAWRNVNGTKISQFVVPGRNSRNICAGSSVCQRVYHAHAIGDQTSYEPTIPYKKRDIEAATTYARELTN